MQYLYHPDTSKPSLELIGDAHRYLFKVRRHRVGEQVYLRNLRDGILYTYFVSAMDRKIALLKLETQRELPIMAERKLHIAWCLIDPKSIEKMIPTLNEMGVEKITFIYCERSQKQFKLDLTRLEKILLNSSQQCGRSVMMILDFADSLEVFMERYPHTSILHFSENMLSRAMGSEPIVIGCEGGFSEIEIALFPTDKIIGLHTPLILRSESAVTAVASKILL